MNDKSRKEFSVRLKILLNKKLFEDKIIPIDIYEDMGAKLINNMSKV